MELIGVRINNKGGFELIKPKTKFFSFELFPTPSHPEIILTKEEAKERNLTHLIPQKLSLRDKLLNNGRRGIAYIKIEGIKVPLTLKEG